MEKYRDDDLQNNCTPFPLQMSKAIRLMLWEQARDEDLTRSQRMEALKRLGQLQKLVKRAKL